MHVPHPRAGARSGSSSWSVLAILVLSSLLLARASNAAPAASGAPTGGAVPAAKPTSSVPAPVPQPRLEDFIAPPGSTQKFQPFMLHADLWLGIDQRAKLDTLVFVLDNGARACQVMNRDSTWAVDYTWVYPHNLMPSRWYDARSLYHTGDSLKLADDADLHLTFGTLRTAVRATSLKTAEAEAYRLWPTRMPTELQGRLKLKVERAKKAMAGERETEPTPPAQAPAKSAKPSKSGGSQGTPPGK